MLIIYVRWAVKITLDNHLWGGIGLRHYKYYRLHNINIEREKKGKTYMQTQYMLMVVSCKPSVQTMGVESQS